jgi:hypothetical protein
VKARHKLVICIALVAASFAGAAVQAPRASASAPCWKVLLTDWYDGRIDHVYPIHCYTDALKHLPPDVQTYSSAHDDILRALQSAITKQKSEHKNVSNNTLVPPEQNGSGGTGSGGSGGSGSGGDGTTTTNSTSTSTTGEPGRNDNGGLAGSVSSDNPSSIPTPLLILGGLALLLVAAGAAGLIAKRVQARRRDV